MATWAVKDFARLGQFVRGSAELPTGHETPIADIFVIGIILIYLSSFGPEKA
jgi:hypothetical protein